MGVFNSLTGSAIRYLIWIVIALTLLGILYFFWNSERHVLPQTEPVQKVEEPLILFNPVLQEFEKDKLKIRLIADKAQIFENKQRTLLTNISADLYVSDTPGSATHLQAGFAEMSAQSNLVRLWGAVRLETRDGQSLLTEELFLNNADKTVYNQVAVTAYTDQETIKAASMHYDLKKGILLLNQPSMQVKL